MQSNATQVPVVDLSGTTWEINTTINAVAGYGEFSINWKDGYENSHNEFNIGFGIYPAPVPPPPMVYGSLAGCVSDSYWNIFASNNL